MSSHVYTSLCFQAERQFPCNVGQSYSDSFPGHLYHSILCYATHQMELSTNAFSEITLND